MPDAPAATPAKRTCARCKYDMTGINSPTCPECGYTAPSRKRECTSCGYDLSGAPSDTCPECGYTPTLEEIALAERRATFAELLRWRQWWSYFWPVAPYLLLSFHQGLWMVARIAVIFTLLSLVCGEIAGRQLIDVPRGQMRAARTLWRVNLRWLQLPMCGPGYTVFGILVWDEITGPGWGIFSSYWGGFGPEYVWAMVGGAAAGLLTTWPAWWYSSRRLLRSSGITAEYRDPRRFARAARWALRPQGIGLAVPVVTYAIIGIVDALFPNWWR